IAAIITILSVPVLWAAVPLVTTVGALIGIFVFLWFKDFSHLFWWVLGVFAVLEVVATGTDAKTRSGHLVFLLAAFLPIELTWVYSTAEVIPVSFFCAHHSEKDCTSFREDVARLKRIKTDELSALQKEQKEERYSKLSREEQDLYKACKWSVLPDSTDRHPEACDRLGQDLQAKCGEACTQQLYLDQCEDNNILGCFRASAYTTDQSVITKLSDECFFNETVTSSYIKSSHFNFPLACDALVTFYQRRLKLEPRNQEYQHNIQTYAKSGCNQNVPYSCYIHGSLLLAAKDASGLDAIQKSCDGGLKYACDYLQNIKGSRGTASIAPVSSGP
ncbi:MAG TPA: hypothetical protein VN132_03590, partial [Bdellovibrio sp.]|nr:hypothetical protein [Bdellovibrio sp.]